MASEREAERRPGSRVLPVVGLARVARGPAWPARIRSEHGMTLIELMVVIAILAIIAAIAMTVYQDLQKKSRLAADQGTIAALRSAVAIYYGRNNGQFPNTATLPTLVTPPPNFQCPTGTYVYTSANGRLTYSPNDVGSC